MQALDTDLSHFSGDGVFAVSGKPVHTRPQQEMRANCLCRTEEFIDIALSISDVNAAVWLREQRR